MRQSDPPRPAAPRSPPACVAARRAEPCSDTSRPPVATFVQASSWRLERDRVSRSTGRRALRPGRAAWCFTRSRCDPTVAEGRRDDHIGPNGRRHAESVPDPDAPSTACPPRRLGSPTAPRKRDSPPRYPLRSAPESAPSPRRVRAGRRDVGFGPPKGTADGPCLRHSSRRGDLPKYVSSNVVGEGVEILHTSTEGTGRSRTTPSRSQRHASVGCGSIHWCLMTPCARAIDSAIGFHT